MEDFLSELLTSGKFTLPYLDDKNNKVREMKARASVAQALGYIQSHQEELVGQSLDDAVLYLALNREVEPWNNKELVCNAAKLLKELIGSSSSHLTQFLTNNPKFCSKVNQLFASKLRRDSWQEHAPLVALYKWYCSHLKFPLVSEYLDVMLPPSLMLLDSYDDGLKVSGVQCLTCIMSECGKTELTWHGRAQVIFDVLEKLSYTHHEPLVTVLHPAIIQILKVLERDAASGESEKKVDVVYHRLLSDMYLEDKLMLRRTYALSLKQYILYLKSDVIKHLKLTMRVTLSYLEDSCGSAELTRTTILEIVALLIKLASPRIERCFPEITKSLLRLVVDCAMLSVDADIQESITSHISEIFRLMMEQACTFIRPSLDLLINEMPLKNDKKGSALLNSLKEMRQQLS